MFYKNMISWPLYLCTHSRGNFRTIEHGRI